MTEPAAIADPLVGNILDGRYRLQRMLGRGGMGCVYGAEHVGIGRAVAIKVLDPQLVSDDNARKRFEREAQSTGRLRHANCVGVTDFGAMPDGSPYLAMELVEGTTIEHVLDDEERLPVERAVHIMRHVLRGLAHAHAQGLVHRDLKPCNIMLVTEAGERDFAKILDFGLARLLSGGGDRLTQVGVVCGTPRYMAPEQVLDGVLGPHVDLYAASVIFFEMITGRTPFDSDEATKILRMHLKDPVPAMRAIAPGVAVPAPIEALIRRGLSKAPEERPATAEEYLVELERAVAPATVASTPPPTPPRPARLARLVTDVADLARAVPRFSRRYLVVVAAAVAFVVVLVVVILGRHTSTAPVAAATSDGADLVPELEMEPASGRSIDPAIDEAMRLARGGRGQDAIRKLKQLERERPGDARVPYALGRVYDGLGWPKQMIDSYRAAIHLDRGLREDHALIRDLIDQLDSRSSWPQAARSLELDVGAAALPALIDASLRHPSSAVRERAAALRRKLGTESRSSAAPAAR